VTCAIGLPLGVLAALKRNTAADVASMAIALFGVTSGNLLARRVRRPRRPWSGAAS
jgi:ABC-type dipeptide/oligopeptide/nickel transport system permease component